MSTGGGQVFVGSYGEFLKQGQYIVLVDALDADGNVSNTVPRLQWERR